MEFMHRDLLPFCKEQAVVESQKEIIKLLKEQIDNLNTQINRLDSNLNDKDEIIRLLKERGQ